MQVNQLDITAPDKDGITTLTYRTTEFKESDVELEISVEAQKVVQSYANRMILQGFRLARRVNTHKEY
jgi:hypothetical protein